MGSGRRNGPTQMSVTCVIEYLGIFSTLTYYGHHVWSHGTQTGPAGITAGVQIWKVIMYPSQQRLYSISADVVVFACKFCCASHTKSIAQSRRYDLGLIIQQTDLGNHVHLIFAHVDGDAVSFYWLYGQAVSYAPGQVYRSNACGNYNNIKFLQMF